MISLRKYYEAQKYWQSFGGCKVISKSYESDESIFSNLQEEHKSQLARLFQYCLKCNIE